MGRAIPLVVLCVVLATLSGERKAGPRRRDAGPPALQVEAAVKQQLPQRAPAAGARVVLIRKRDRVLARYVNGALAAAYPIALGTRPEGPKQREGDRRTPEGRYYICTRNANSAYHLFLGISYPNAEDAAAGLRAGLITRQQREEIVSATRDRERPPWDTPLGGEVGLHGGGTGRDWTWGCIALEDAAIEELWDTLKMGDTVVIEP